MRWTRVIFSVLFLAVVFTATATAQSSQCPQGMVCISQAAANAAAENARELAATREKIIVMQDALLEKDKTIAENKDAASKNEADLKDRLHKTEVELATKTGTLIGCEANEVRNTATISAFLQNMKTRNKIGLFVF